MQNQIMLVLSKKSWATANPNRKNRIAPKMVEMAVKKTGAVPNLELFMICNQVLNYRTKDTSMEK